jgi:hypothetical protein
MAQLLVCFGSLAHKNTVVPSEESSDFHHELEEALPGLYYAVRPHEGFSWWLTCSNCESPTPVSNQSCILRVFNAHEYAFHGTASSKRLIGFWPLLETVVLATRNLGD